MQVRMLRADLLHGLELEREELRALKRRIREQRYDAILDIHNSNRSRYLRLFSGTRHLRVVNKRAFARFMLVKFKQHWYQNNIPSIADRYLETAKLFGVEDDGEGLEVFIPDGQSSAVAGLLSKYRLDRYEHVVGIVPVARHLTKRWLPERFVELALALTKQENTKTLFFGGAEDVDYCGDIVQMVNSRAGWTAAESLAGAFSLLETASAFDACQLVVTNDTGLMHLAAARKRKVVGIFGSTVREFGFFPYGTENIVVERAGLPCRPCTHVGLEKCPQGHFRCMKDIQADEVYDAVQTLLTNESTHNAVRNA